MVKRIIFSIVCVSACSCSHLDLKGLLIPTGEGVERRFEQSREMNMDLKARCVKTEERYTFYVATDPHIDQTNSNLSKFNDALRNDTAASFGVILGDCVDIKDNLPKSLEALSYSPEKQV